MATISSTSFGGETLEIIAFRLHDQEFCVKTTTIREIRGWAPSTPIPHAPADVIGVMNLRGSVIPIIDLAYKLGMKSTVANERSAIVVAEVHNMVIGMLVDRVSDILTIPSSQVQPVPKSRLLRQDLLRRHHRQRKRHDLLPEPRQDVQGQRSGRSGRLIGRPTIRFERAVLHRTALLR